jgi:hypothetical protein
VQHLQYRGKLGIAVGGERLVEALAPEPGLAGDLRHALGAGDVAQGCGDQCGIAIFEHRFQIQRDVPLGLQISRRIPGNGFDLAHGSLLELAREFERDCDVTALRTLVATGQQDDERAAAPDEIHPIARALVDPHFRDALADRFYVAGISNRQTPDACVDAHACPAVAKARQPA